MKFTELNLDSKLLEALSYMGFEEATPIQQQVIPLILQNKDLIACAQTGTGKTGAFVLPILNKLIGKQSAHVDTLIIVPTRELAIQIEMQIQGFSYFVNAGSIAVYGGGDGADWELQKHALQKGADVIVATPGKLLSHLKMGYVKFDKISHLVLDEADRMLDMGFIDDIQEIISYLPPKHQTLMFSATMPQSIRQLAKKILHNPVEIALSMSKPAEGVDQKAYFVFEDQKISLVGHILSERKHYDSILIFSSSKSKISEIVRALNRSGFPAEGISSNLEQDKREEVLRDFRSKRIRILVATDVMSRGIDVKEIHLVINFDVPHDAEDYVHRVGRTARVNAKGEAITLVTPKERQKLRQIEQLIDSIIPKIEPPGDLAKDQPSARPNPRPRPRPNRGEVRAQGSKKRKFYRKKQG
ncbi:MAG: DEAD/DEAH box helicase [Bacteroidetes bacterium]|nr:DEAD/DEAH box helicase [Bacteroidota bacterium]MBU1717570.1 DEAD/DEAH box helicase [Bacteroidota bacterium]